MNGQRRQVGETCFNIGTLFDLVAEAVPDRIALIWGEERVSYGELARRSDNLAAHLQRAGIRRDQTVGMMMGNAPAFIEVLLALFKLGAIPFSVNYRYTADELAGLAADANASGLIYDADLADVVAAVLPDIPPLTCRMIVEQPEGLRAGFGEVLSYLACRDTPLDGADIDTGRRDDDRVLIYTGGTTGRPKGVEWEHRELFFGALGGGGVGHPDGPIDRPEAIAERAVAGRPYVMLGAGPLMHGASLYGAFNVLLGGATIIIPRSRGFEPDLIWDLIEREGVFTMSLMGDAMIRPLLAAWDANPGRWTITAFSRLGSGGGTLAEDTLRALAERFPKLAVINGMGSSESGMLGVGEPASGDGLIVINPRPDLGVIVDGTRLGEVGEMGILARSGHLPRGYWRDPEKSAATFVTVGGRRWVLTGDRAKREADGRIRMYGRDSNIINTGGEKVFAEEVEIAIRSHPAVMDASVVGIPHERWGQAVAAVLSAKEGHTVTLEELRDHCASRLARYKLPQRIVLCEEVRRSPAGKVDVRWAKSMFEASEADRLPA